MNAETTIYQDELVTRFRELVPDTLVKKEWSAVRDRGDLYSPQLDVSVGPFSTGDQQLADEYDKLVQIHNELLRSLREDFSGNVESIYSEASVPTIDAMTSLNLNARCFLAIEIERSGSRKHVMGSAVNAAALGRVGICVAWDMKMLRLLLRIWGYLDFLASVGKNSFNTRNLIIVTKDQLDEKISKAG